MQKNIEKTLLNNSFFRDMADDILQNFLEKAHLKHVSKGHILFQQDDNADLFFLIQKGWVKLFKQTLDGNEAVIDVVNDHYMIGETALFNNSQYTSSAEAAEPCDIISFPTYILNNAIENTPEIAIKMLKIMSSYRKQQDLELENRDIKNAPQRIGCFLLRLCPYPYDRDDITLYLPYDKTLIASRLGMKAETFSRGLNKLKESNNINVSGSTITIPSIHRIKEYTCAFCSAIYPCKDH